MALHFILQPVIEANSLVTAGPRVICNCYFVWCIWYLVLVWCVPCIICVRYDPEVCVTLIHAWTHSLWHGGGLQVPLWSIIVLLYTLYFCEAHFGISCVPPSSGKDYLWIKTSTVSKMRYWRTAKEFPRVELPSDLRSATIYSTGRYMMNYGVCFFFLENPPLRPILMQLDLQSVEKIPFSTFAWAFAPEMWGTGLSRLRMSRSFLQDLSRAVSRFSRGPVGGNNRQHFFDPTWPNTI